MRRPFRSRTSNRRYHLDLPVVRDLVVGEDLHPGDAVPDKPGHPGPYPSGHQQDALLSCHLLLRRRLNQRLPHLFRQSGPESHTITGIASRGPTSCCTMERDSATRTAAVNKPMS